MPETKESQATVTLEELKAATDLNSMAKAITEFESNTTAETRLHLDKIKEFIMACADVLDLAEWKVRQDIRWALIRDPEGEKQTKNITRHLRNSVGYLEVAARRVDATWRAFRARLRYLASKEQTNRKGRKPYQAK
ncbi:hypothetical protein ACFFMN_23195 [Planobispora siamensis]|uniref:Uncharacterized protein n=1 Tax=Planobispora siamensis TaxID=936338 RepID=A0A8J3WMS0_9ACTN|nr:hypothetical protein [Planobispora siamensis]GIH95268.1 hypothetical protein Psi01_58980 [Planobispora siamensis]